MDANCRKRARDHGAAEPRPGKRPAAPACSPPVLPEGIRTVALEDRVGGLMRELMEEIGPTQKPAADLPVSAPSYSCDSASSSTSCSSKVADTHCAAADVPRLGDVDSGLVLDLGGGGPSAIGGPDDPGGSAPGQNLVEWASDESDYNWLQNVFSGSDDDAAVDLQALFPCEEEAALWCFACEDDDIGLGLDADAA